MPTNRRLRLLFVASATALATISFSFTLLLQRQDAQVQRLALLDKSYNRLDAPVASTAMATSRAINDTFSLSTSKLPILFVHFHKSGGTSVCESMRLFQKQVNITNALGEAFDPYLLELNNCNFEFTHPHLDDRFFSSVQNCRMLEPYTMDESGTSFRRNNFISVEIPLNERMPCPRFRSFAIMREPVKRVISHLIYEKVSEEKAMVWIDKRLPGTRKRDFFMNGYSVINNMVIRQLLGRKRFISPRPIDEADFKQAKLQVDKFHAFVPLEHLKHPTVLELLNDTVPEYYEGLIKNDRIRANQQQATNLTFSSDFVETVRENNKYDILLYEYVLGKLGLVSPMSVS